MPNWIEGTLKLRGKYDDLRKFFDDGIESVGKTYESNYSEVVVHGEPWVKDSRRAFLEDGGYAYWECEPDEKYTVALPIRQAWNFDDDNWKAVSKNYNLDIRLDGFEQGMQFQQTLEIIGGVITKDETVEYDDWDWECPMPKMGG